MTDQLSWSTVGEWLAGFAPEGPLRTAVLLVYGLCAALAPFIYKYYLGVLAQGAAPEGSLERQDYDKLRASLAGGNLAARLYADWLTRFLDAVERFFGDKGMADRTLFPHAFGLQKSAPLWTAPAFDRCLLLALLYPIATIFAIWAVSGHVGAAEAGLLMQPFLPGWRRGVAAAMYGFAYFALWRGARTVGLKTFVWVAVAVAFACAGGQGCGPVIVGAVVVAVAGVGVGAGAVAIAVAVATQFAFVVGFVAAFALAGAVLPVAAQVVAVLVAVELTIQVVVLVPVAFAVMLLSRFSIQYRRQGVFLLLFVLAMILICLGAGAAWLSHLAPIVRPLLLFLGLLTLLNAPFDWASLGLTRALLRRGLELGGWWPYLLALVDAALAAVIIALLALVMVLGVQAFDELAAHGGEPVLPLDTLFDGIAKNPAGPEYWWAYALLLSSMIPSITNLAIGGMAFTRGIPWLAQLLLRWIPEGKAVPEYKRQPAAIGLTVQMFAGAGLGIAAQAFLAWGLIFHVMPWIGLDLLDMARAVSALDVPARIGQLFAGSLALK